MNPPPGMPMPFPFPFPGSMWGGSPPGMIIDNNEPPARVKIALEYLHSLTHKTMTRGMVNDVGFDTIEGQQLSIPELEAQSAACKMLTSYFKGKLEPEFN